MARSPGRGPNGPRQGPHASRIYGGMPLALPLVGTLPANDITDTSAFVGATVNPEGLAATWWVAWGTSPAFGNTTTPGSAGSGSVPQSFSVQLTGLVQGTTYYFAAVAQTAAGTVYGFPQSFLADTTPPITTPSEVPPPYQLLPTEPHFAYPFTMKTNGAVTYQQDSAEEVASCLHLIADCRQGDCPELPALGIPDETFAQVPINPSQLQDVLLAQEPRATLQITTNALGDLFTEWGEDLTAQVAGSILNGT